MAVVMIMIVVMRVAGRVNVIGVIVIAVAVVIVTGVGVGCHLDDVTRSGAGLKTRKGRRSTGATALVVPGRSVQARD
jgi:hypothetical protein